MPSYRVATVTEFIQKKPPMNTSVPIKGVTDAISGWVEKGWDLFAIERIPTDVDQLTCLLTFRREE